MPKDKAFAWYKWWAGRARSSERWRSLTITEEGAFRRLYDIAALADDPAHRGQLWFTSEEPYNDDQIALVLRVPKKTWRTISAKLLQLKLITQNTEANVYTFPDFAKHQHSAGLRHRTDRPKRVPKRSQSGPNVGQEKEEEGEVEKEVEKREKKKTLPAPPDPRVKEFIDWFFEAYQTEFGSKYPVVGGRDGKLVKTMLQTLSLEQLKQATPRMFADDFARGNGAGINQLAAQMPKWLAPPMPTPAEQAREERRKWREEQDESRRSRQAGKSGAGPVADDKMVS